MKTVFMKIFFIAVFIFFTSQIQTAKGGGNPVGDPLPDNFLLKVGFFEFPGLTYTDEGGNAAGLVNEITIKTLENAKIKYSISSYPAPRLYKNLSEGNIHFFNGVSAIPVVSQSMIPSHIRLFPLEMRIYWIGDKRPISKKEELAGHSVILVRGFSYKDWGAWIRNSKNNVSFFDPYSHESAFKMLRKGRAEYLLNYKYIDSEVLDKIEIPNLVIKPLYLWYCSFNVHKNVPNAEALIKKLEASYQQLINKGKLKKYE